MALETKPDRLRQLLEEALSLLDDREMTPEPAENGANDPWNKGDKQLITGKVGNPRFTRTNGKALWRAGIGVPDANGKLRWLNVTAWGELAEHADQFGRGEMVTVTGTPKKNRYVDNDGVAQERDDFVLSSIDWAE